MVVSKFLESKKNTISYFFLKILPLFSFFLRNHVPFKKHNQSSKYQNLKNENQITFSKIKFMTIKQPTCQIIYINYKIKFHNSLKIYLVLTFVN